MRIARHRTGIEPWGRGFAAAEGTCIAAERVAASRLVEGSVTEHTAEAEAVESSVMEHNAEVEVVGNGAAERPKHTADTQVVGSEEQA